MDEDAIEITARSPDLVAARLLEAAYTRPPVALFDEPLEVEPEQERLALLKLASDLIVKARLARFDDEGRTTIVLTNAGRYWALHGGYLAFLREEPLAVGTGGRSRNPEMEALRSEYMRLRLNTFWWSFGLSIAGFIFSVISVLIAVFYGDRILPR
jgi:hypothetical protein